MLTIKSSSPVLLFHVGQWSSFQSGMLWYVLNCIICVFEVLQQYLDRPAVHHRFTSVFNRVQLTVKYHSKQC